jgi:hypothetical protein
VEHPPSLSRTNRENGLALALAGQVRFSDKRQYVLSNSEISASRDDKTAIELFRRGVVELQTSEPNICGHVVAVLA